MSIRQKFITTLVLIGLLPLAVLAIVVTIFTNNVLQSNTIDLLESAAIKQEQRLTSLLQSKQEEAVKLANQYDLQLAVKAFMAGDTRQKTTVQEILQDSMGGLPAVKAIIVTGPERTAIASTSNDKYTKDIISSIDVTPDADLQTFTTIRKDPIDNTDLLAITTQIIIGRQQTAALYMLFRTDEATAIVQDFTGLGDTGETVVIDAKGLSQFPLRSNTLATLKQQFEGMNISAENQDSTLRTGTDYRGKQVYYVTRDLSQVGWTLITKIDKDESFAPVTALRDSILSIVALAAIITMAVALVFARLITRPILEVARIAERIGRGDLSAHIRLHRKDEIGLLADSIDSMGMNLHTMVGNIEYQRQRLQTILDTTTEAIFAIDVNNQVLIANKAVTNLLHDTPEQIVGKKMQDLFQWQAGPERINLEYNVSEVTTYNGLEYIDKEGTHRYARVIVAPVLSMIRQDAATAIITIHDETSKHDLENMKTDFVSMAAHELRTPLTAIRGYLDMLEYKIDAREIDGMMDYTKRAQGNVVELGSLISSLLDVSRIERGTLTLTMDKVNLGEIMTKVMSDNKFAASDRAIKLSYTSALPDPCVVGDQMALKEVINNLVGNAIKYTMPGGEVEVAVDQVDAYYQVAIRDTGIGISKAAQEHLFTKFYRVKGGLDSGSTGTGLGLFIAKSIVERHHGTITVESKEGIGSTFTLQLPVYTDEFLAQLQPKDDTGSQDNVVRRKRGWITKNITR